MYLVISNYVNSCHLHSTYIVHILGFANFTLLPLKVISSISNIAQMGLTRCNDECITYRLVQTMIRKYIELIQRYFLLIFRYIDINLK